MKKFVISKTGEEVHFGDVIKLQRKKTTSFGVYCEETSLTLTPYNIFTFLDTGVLKLVEDKKDNDESDNIGTYIDGVSKKLNCTSAETIAWLERLNKVCPKAVLDILLQEIAIEFYEKDKEAFNNTSVYYSLRPKDGKVGKVNINNSYIPLFKSEEDAEKARALLKKQLDFMYAKQKDC